MPLYFAYGANMDIAAMAVRAPGAKPLGLARLVRHRFVITEHGYASITRDPRGAVHGLLWEVPLAQIRALDRFEEVDRGLYVKIEQPVITANGPRRALVYVGTGKPGGKARAGYLADVIRAATEIGLPAAYLKEMAALGQGASAPAGRKGTTGPRASETWSWGD
jgi:gamma-glutamylcyclotransferase (GGCT)/AIG2-like uncharacterized protein YtfP